jgi:hypothetical protein
VRRSLFRHTLLGACLSAPFLLAGCGGDQGVPQNFPPLRYTYLAPIALNVSSIQTQVAYAPTDDGTSLDAMSPEAPIQAVEQMLQDRLVASGTGGTATVTINTASLNRVNDTAVGNISVQVAVISADGRRSGYTTASVTRTRTLPDDTSDSALRPFLYQMTSDLVNAENVELEYQMRQHLAGWLVGGTSPIVGGPAAPAPVQAEPLSGPGAPTMGAPTIGAPMPLGAPAPASMPAPSAVPSATPPMPVTTLPGQAQPVDTTPTMPSGDLGLPQGNPLPQDVSPVAPVATPGAPVPLTPAATTGAAPSPAYQLVPSQPPGSSAPAAPAPAAPAAPARAPAPAANPATLPPLPPTITP